MGFYDYKVASGHQGRREGLKGFRRKGSIGGKHCNRLRIYTTVQGAGGDA